MGLNLLCARRAVSLATFNTTRHARVTRKKPRHQQLWGRVTWHGAVKLRLFPGGEQQMVLLLRCVRRCAKIRGTNNICRLSTYTPPIVAKTMPAGLDDKSEIVVPFILQRLETHKKHSDIPFFIGLNGVQGVGKTTLVCQLWSFSRERNS